MASVFILSIQYLSGKLKYPSKLDNSILGYFSILKKAEQSINNLPKYLQGKDISFKKYTIEEHRLDNDGEGAIEENTSYYDEEGSFLGKQLSDTIRGFPGREYNDCKFKRGDWVEFINGINRLDVGIVGGLPPNKKEVKAICKRAAKLGMKIHPLDSSDDCYFVFTGYDNFDHEHPQVFRVFKPSGKIPKKLEKHLRRRFQKAYGKNPTSIASSSSPQKAISDSDLRIKKLRSLADKYNKRKHSKKGVPLKKTRNKFLIPINSFGEMLHRVE